MEDKRKKLYITGAVILIIAIGFVTFLFTKTKDDKVIKNVYIEDINIGNLSKSAAKNKLSNIYKEKDIVLKFEGKTWNIKPKDIDLDYDIEKTVDDAYLINKRSNILENIKKTISSIFGKEYKLNIKLNYNKNKLTNELDKISKDINRKSEDATIDISGDNISITSDIEGIKVDISETEKEIKDNILKNKFICEVITNKKEPKIKKSQLINIDKVLGSYSTKFDGGVSGRTQNIKLAAQRTSDVLLMPGETFSYNEHTKKRTASNGYKNAPVIVQGVVQEGIGGGVCQVSTTLYNATLYAGLEYVELRNHSIPSSYAPKGRDATVADGSIDFVFKNNLEYPIYIKNSVNGNIVTCNIYGSSKDKKNINILTNTDQVSVAPIKKVDDPTLERGKDKVLEKGRDGYVVSTYRVYKDTDGNIIKKEKVAKSYYPKKQGVIAVGVMDVNKKTEIKPEQPIPENNPSTDDDKTEVPPSNPSTPPESNEDVLPQEPQTSQPLENQPAQ
jgi:vancomycin resistance protein YoaR